MIACCVRDLTASSLPCWNSMRFVNDWQARSPPYTHLLCPRGARLCIVSMPPPPSPLLLRPHHSAVSSTRCSRRVPHCDNVYFAASTVLSDIPRMKNPVKRLSFPGCCCVPTFMCRPEPLMRLHCLTDITHALGTQLMYITRDSRCSSNNRTLRHNRFE